MKRGQTGQRDHLKLVKRPQNQGIQQNQCGRVTKRKEINKTSYQTLAKHQATFPGHIYKPATTILIPNQTKTTINHKITDP